jgi:nicotinate phosphoribosyltransferase
MSRPNLAYDDGQLGLFTDLYELTMAQAYFSQGMHQPATFGLTVRSYPPNRGYLVSSGLDDVLDYLSRLHFDDAAIQYLRSIGIFKDDFLEYLRGVRFTGSVRAISEGRLFFTNEPLLEITAPIIEAQLVETYVINQMNLQTALATKAARCVWAAQGRSIADFASRRTHGSDAAMKMARSSYIAGFASTSNVLAASHYNIPPAGTMAHSFISSFPTELDAFRAYADSFPDRTILLLDTYDTIAGAFNAVSIGKELESNGHRLAAVRLDSGDYSKLSRQVRHVLDDHGLDYVKILLSGGLDEYELETLIEDKAPIDLFGVGTKAGVSADAPWSDMVYKVVSFDDRPVIKLSEGKMSLPGTKQIFRRTENGLLSGDIIGLQEETGPVGSEALLQEVMVSGVRIDRTAALSEVRERFREEFDSLDARYKELIRPPLFPVSVSPRLQRMTAEVREEAVLTNVSGENP